MPCPIHSSPGPATPPDRRVRGRHAGRWHRQRLRSSAAAAGPPTLSRAPLGQSYHHPGESEQHGRHRPVETEQPGDSQSGRHVQPDRHQHAHPHTHLSEHAGRDRQPVRQHADGQHPRQSLHPEHGGNNAVTTGSGLTTLKYIGSALGHEHDHRPDSQQRRVELPSARPAGVDRSQPADRSRWRAGR